MDEEMLKGLVAPKFELKIKFLRG